ncbi:MAG: AbrB/MazE/SpoVT family DNA-binding domain-containing protein, partial [Spirulinaceae cyanobacterium]
MTSTITKWGNSLAIRIPKALAEEIDCTEGTTVSLTVLEGKLIITPRRKKYTLEELLQGMTSKQFHSETDIG